MRTPGNILRHELIGLYCEVVSSKNKIQAGVKGKIVDETMKTLVIDDKRIQKTGTTFRLTIDDKKVDIDGSKIVARPEDRIKKKYRKW